MGIMSTMERIESTLEKIKSLRDQPSDYPRLVWVILVFYGGVVNALVIKLFIDYTLPIYQYVKEHKIVFTAMSNWQVNLATILVGGISVFLVPIAYSLMYSSSGLERKLIPPLAMEAISFVLLAYFFYSQFVANFPILYAIGFYAIVGGIAQDGIVTSALGKSLLPDRLIKHSFLVHANIEKVKQLVISKQFRVLYNLKVVKPEKGETLKLRTSRRRGFTLILEVREGKLSNEETILNAVFYDLANYTVNPIEPDSDAFEWAMLRIGALKGYLERHLSVNVDDATTANAISLAQYVADDMAGYISHFQGMATRRQVLLVLSLSIMAVSLVPFAFNQIEAGFVVLLAGIAMLVDAAFRE